MPVAPQPSHGYFYPRSPCGERLTILLITVTTLLFLSTLSLRRATAFFQQAADITQISIHALLAESDCITAQPQHRTHQISIHALLAESDDILLQPALAF